MKMKTVLKTSMAVIAFVCFSSVLHAQGPGGPGPDPDPDPPAPASGTSAPFDFRIGILVAAGIIYAAKRKFDAGRQAKQVEYISGK